MSFSNTQKREIIAQLTKNNCCMRAFLRGVLASRGHIDKSGVVIHTSGLELADLLIPLIKEVYGKKSEVLTSTSGGRRAFVSFSAPSAVKQILSFTEFDNAYDKKCNMCESWFFRGIFFISGKISDPEKQFNLEFSVEDKADSLMRYLFSRGLSPKLRESFGKKVIYFKRSSDIEDFFALAAMNNAVFALMNAKMTNELRNNVNRLVNCETNNMDRAGVASDRCIHLIEELVRLDMLSYLPEDLEQTARLRYKNPELSLSRLATLHTPTISKSGLSHRLKRIEEYASRCIKK